MAACDGRKQRPWAKQADFFSNSDECRQRSYWGSKILNSAARFPIHIPSPFHHRWAAVYGVFYRLDSRYCFFNPLTAGQIHLRTEPSAAQGLPCAPQEMDCSPALTNSRQRVGRLINLEYDVFNI